jgi:hypothetical protein
MLETLLDRLIEYRFELASEDKDHPSLGSIDEYVSLALAKRIPIGTTPFEHIFEYRSMLKGRADKPCLEQLDAYIRRYLMENSETIHYPPKIVTLNVHTLPKNGHISLRIDLNNDTIGYVKRRIQQLMGLNPRVQKLISGGKILSFNEYTLTQYGLEKGQDIYLIHIKAVVEMEPLKMPQSAYTRYEEPVGGREGDEVISTGMGTDLEAVD